MILGRLRYLPMLKTSKYYKTSKCRLFLSNFRHEYLVFGRNSISIKIGRTLDRPMVIVFENMHLQKNHIQNNREIRDCLGYSSFSSKIVFAHFWNLISAPRWKISIKWQNVQEIWQLPSRFLEQILDRWRARFMKTLKIAKIDRASNSRPYTGAVASKILVGLEKIYKSPYCASCYDLRLCYNVG